MSNGMEPGVSAPDSVMAGVFEPVSSKVTTSLSLKAARADPFSQFETVVFQLLAEPSPRHSRFAGGGAAVDETPMIAPLNDVALAGGGTGVTQTVTATFKLYAPSVTMKLKVPSPEKLAVGTKSALVPS